MIDESLLKINFVGKDGFRWWVGQIAPAAVQGDQLSPSKDSESWSYRRKVRILGYHPFSKAELPDADLPWATALIPTTSGTGGANFAKTVVLRPGDVVIGFFLDGENAQQPVILGSFSRTNDVSQDLPSDSLGFLPFTGYTDKIKPPSGTLDSGESNESRTDSQISPVTRKVDSSEDKISASSTFGKSVVTADTCADNFVNQVSSSLDNLLSVVSEGSDFLGDVASVTKKLQRLSNAPASTMMESLYTSLIPELQGGLQRLYDETYAKVFAATQNSGLAKLAGIEAQKSQIPKVASLQGSLDCLAGKVVNGLEKTIRDLITSAILEVVDTGVCIAEQFAGSLLNGITDEISKSLDAPLAGVNKILTSSFKVQDILRSSSDTFKSIGGLLDCNQDDGKCVGRVKRLTLGYGPDRKFDLQNAYDNVLKNMNIATTLGRDSGPLQKPDCATPSFCGPPTVEFVGGSGFGGLGKVILGGVVRNTEGLSDVTADFTRTASLLGVEITDPGSSYFELPPIVNFQDPCKKGYGAAGEALVDYDPNSDTYGQIIAVNIISEGENFPVPNNDANVIIAGDVPVGVIDTIVAISGNGYDINNTTASDGNTEYNLVIEDGKILSARPINNIGITELPSIIVSSPTGSGALIKPIIGRLPLSPQGEVLQIIDCVGPETNKVVGYVDGKPYYGSYHVMSDGTKMTGLTHGTNESIIYDTPEQSFTPNIVGVAQTTTTNTVTNDQPIITPTMNTPTTPPPSTPPSTPPSDPPSGGGGYGGY